MGIEHAERRRLTDEVQTLYAAKMVNDLAEISKVAIITKVFFGKRHFGEEFQEGLGCLCGLRFVE